MRRILIVGGGVAGWMAAACLNRTLGRTGCEVTLVESTEIGTLGVGEASVPPLVSLIRQLQIDEVAFMRKCSATYNLGTKYLDWLQEGHAFWRAFGPCGGTIDGLDLFHFWRRSSREGGSEGPYSSYSLQAFLAENGKAPRPFQGPSTIMEQGSYAYHLDASAFADVLSEIATTEGVKHLFDEVNGVVLDATGAIERIETASGRRLTADLYVDCSGSRGLLIEESLGDPWVDLSGELLCDRAVVLPLPHDPRSLPYERVTALSSGWMWQIPMSHRVGCGYVYSSSHIDEDSATRELIARVSLPRARAADPRALEMRVGHRTHFWARNCVSVGPAAGALDPLASTSIHLIHSAVGRLIEHLPDRRFNPVLARAYNAKMHAAWDEVRDFVRLHYRLSRRDAGGFWDDSRDAPMSDALAERIEFYEESGRIDRTGALFRDTSFYFLLSGCERLPRRLLPEVVAAPLDKIREVLAQIKTQTHEWADTLPSHQALMEWIHRPEV